MPSEARSGVRAPSTVMVRAVDGELQCRKINSDIEENIWALLLARRNIGINRYAFSGCAACQIKGGRTLHPFCYTSPCGELNRILKFVRISGSVFKVHLELDRTAALAQRLLQSLYIADPIVAETVATISWAAE